MLLHHVDSAGGDYQRSYSPNVTPPPGYLSKLGGGGIKTWGGGGRDPGPAVSGVLGWEVHACPAKVRSATQLLT